MACSWPGKPGLAGRYLPQRVTSYTFGYCLARVVFFIIGLALAKGRDGRADQQPRNQSTPRQRSVRIDDFDGDFMKIYIVTLAVGVLVGLIYALLQVRSPAPPAIALVGLLGILIGEQAVPVVKKLLSGQPVTAAWLRTECVAQITGVQPPAALHAVGQEEQAARHHAG